MPGFDPRIDYFTGCGDQTATGGAPNTIPGYGPNTRTVMQIRVAAGASSTAPANDYNPATLTALQTALANIFRLSQDKIIVPEPDYNAAYNGNFLANYGCNPRHYPHLYTNWSNSPNNHASAAKRHSRTLY